MNSEKSPFDDALARIAHKIRTPLTVIRSSANNLLDGTYGKLTSDQAKSLQKMEAHTQNLEGLINEIIKILQDGGTQTAETLDNQLEETVQQGAPAVHPAQPQEPLSEAQRKDGVPKILVVDDEEDILDVIQEGMKMKGYEVRAFSNGPEALRFALDNKVDLVLMDVHLQSSNGVELSAELKQKAEEFIPIVLVTGQNDFKRKKGEDPSADDVLMKPFFMEELFSRVDSMLRYKKIVDELRRLKNKGVR